MTFISPQSVLGFRRRRRSAAMISLGITVAVGVAIIVLLFCWLLPGLLLSEPTISPRPLVREDVPIEVEHYLARIQPRPAAPSAVTPPLLTTAAATSVAAPPAPELSVEPIVAIGTGVGGFGLGELGLDRSTPVMQNDGQVTFFGQSSQMRRVVFVIDFSPGSAQRRAIHAEVRSALEGMPSETRYQIVGFAGAAWFLGDVVDYHGQDQPITVTGGDGRHYEHTWPHHSGYAWEESRNWIPRADWLSASEDNIRRSLDQLESQGRLGGTNFAIALETAMTMSPAPDVIYFLTDGHHNAGNELSAEEVAEEWGRELRRSDARIYCIALVEERAVEGLRELADQADAVLVQAHADGSAEVIEDFR